METLKVENGKLIIPQGITIFDRKSYMDKDRKWIKYRELITTVILPESITAIGKQAFDGFKNLKSLFIPNTVKSIGEVSFRDCVSLKELFIPASVENIDKNAFFCCSALESISVENGNSHYDSRNDCNAIIETATNELIKGGNFTIIPSTIERIRHSAFMNCSKLTEIVIPESVQFIGDAAFWNCKNLKKLCIMNPHVQIGMNAFYGTPFEKDYRQE